MEELKYCKVQKLLKFNILNRHIHPEEYCFSMLFLFFPFRKRTHGWSSCKLLLKTLRSVVDAVDENRALVEPYADVADEDIETLELHANSDIESVLVEHGPVEEEAVKNEMKEDDITLGGDQLVNADVVHLIQSVSNIENDGTINATFVA